MSEEDTQRRLDSIESKLNSMDKKLSALETDIARYRGLVGGVLLVVTAILTFGRFLWDFVHGK